MKNKTKTNKPKPDKDINYLIKKHYYHNDLTVAEQQSLNDQLDSLIASRVFNRLNAEETEELIYKVKLCLFKKVTEGKLYDSGRDNIQLLIVMMCSFKILDILRKKYKRIDVNNFTDLRVEDDTFSIYYDDETRQAKQGCQKLYMDDRDS